jgi:hypothetical protein
LGLNQESFEYTTVVGHTSTNPYVYPLANNATNLSTGIVGEGLSQATVDVSSGFSRGYH